MVELWGSDGFVYGGTRRKRGRRQRGGLAGLYELGDGNGGTRRNRGRRQRG
jgi:hypothetical protein